MTSNVTWAKVRGLRCDKFHAFTEGRDKSICGAGYGAGRIWSNPFPVPGLRCARCLAVIRESADSAER